MNPAIVRAIEAATRAAIPPAEVLEDHGWVLCANGGVIGRANSVWPEAGHDDPEARIRRAEEFYRDRGLPTKFRIARDGAGDLIATLRARGFRSTQPTLVMTTARAPGPRPAGVSMVEAPGPEWIEVFASAGDPAEGPGRVEALTRGRNRFASIGREKGVEAVGVIGGAGGWQGLHGMRTRPQARRQGHALRLASALMAEAAGDAGEGFFLQVECANAPAIALYGRLGFAPAWTYDYWIRD